MRADNETRAVINVLLDQTKAAFEDRNVDDFIKLTTNDPNMLNIGPAKDEMSIGPGQLKERFQNHFAMADTVTLKYGYTTIKSNGNVAWVSSHLWETLTKGTRKLMLDMRMTAVAEKIDNKWGWSEMHWSLPGEVKMPDPTAEEKAAEEAAAKAAREAEEAKKKAEEDKRKAELKADEPPTDQSFFDYY
jgi:hypothetical protein